MQTLRLIKKYETYPEYKDTGIDWLGKIPGKWSYDKLSHNLSKNDGGVWGEDDLLQKGKIVLRSTEISQYGTWNLETAATRLLTYSEFMKGKLFSGDLLITKSSGSPEHLGKTALVTDDIEKMECAFSNFMQRLRVNKNYLPKYLFYLLNCKIGREQINYWGATTSGLVNLNGSIIGKFTFTIPLLNEQAGIVNYLDKKTQLIDQVIEKKKKLIELLCEKRTAVINKTINSTSGKLGKLKHFAKINPSRQSIEVADISEAVSFVPMEAISEIGCLTLQERKYAEVKEGFTFFRNGDVVLAKITPCYENGKAGVMKGLKNGFGFGTTEFIVIRPNRGIISDYLYYLIFSDKFRKLGEVEMHGTAGQKRVTNYFVKNYEFHMPDVKQQEAVVSELNTRTNLIDDALLKVEKSIDMLQEFKSSLISNVVTGKVKI